MKKPKALKMALASSLMAMLLSGCDSTGNDSAFSPIYIHKDDQLTDGTARQILQHNQTGQSLYGW